MLDTPSGATIPDKIKAFVNTENPLMYMLSSTKSVGCLDGYLEWVRLWGGLQSIYLLGYRVKHVG
jgi:hypothetical protein